VSDSQIADPATDIPPAATSLLLRLRDLGDLLDSVPAGILVLDRASKIVVKNKTADHIAGLSLAGALSDGGLTSIYDQHRIRHLDGTPYQADELAPQRALRGEEVLCEQFSLSQLPNGPRRIVLASTAPLRDKDGTIEGTLSVFHDITSLKSVEQERQELLSGAAHDLQNLVTGIIGISQILKIQITNASEQDWSATLELLDTIVSSARRLSTQVNILMDIARNPADRPFALERSPVDLVTLAMRVAEEHRAITTQHAIQVIAGESEITGMFDEHNLHSALANLVGNAIKFSPRGGDITISIKRLLDHGNNQASIAVADTGLGIPTVELPHVFERHYRASNVASSIPGTGLGLTGVQRVVAVHGGALEIDSAEGSGTTVTMRLPITPAPDI
jgi:PAS domain S-box-containing protein